MPKFHVIVGPDATAVYPSVRKIGPADLKDVLAKGIDDFLAMPSSLVFLGTRSAWCARTRFSRSCRSASCCW
jgi:uncharacterized membrane protein